jgi:Asp-tRNA(Asn)/Glu-tRNA(Gln) amidotransferase A subunit family amidase
MDTTDTGRLSSLSAHELADLVRSRRASPVEIVEDLLARIATLEPGSMRAARAFLEAQPFAALP